ncbi:hypothetical protein HYDPIDRAFT_27009 [Hydnomerulius pinastri MD-312]|nr:hypothetical protein HYDPIDRAFT_27009 [Hydnomerulius pinastri MD-312]
MALWTQTSAASERRVWRRPLGITEATFYWDSVLNSTADTVMHIHLRATRPSDVDIYSAENVRRAWSSVRQRFPLLAAEVQEQDSGLHFVLHEERVKSLREGDVTFGSANSFHDAERFVQGILDGPRPLSSKLLTRAYVLRRTDRPDHFHVVVIVAHCITDGCSTSTVLRTFFQTLASPYDPSPLPIEARLSMYHPLETRIRLDVLPPVKRRWRKALGHAMHTVINSRFRGGHTLPGNFTAATPTTPAKSRLQVISFSREVSALILSNCRSHNITLNSAYYALSQVALARVLCRRYLRGEISEEEWEYRKREPMHFNGPLNLRPYQDQDWFEKGGSGDVGLNISFFQYILPFMPLGAMSRKDAGNLELVDGAPLFQDLMSFDRFLLRCEVVRVQAEKLFNHPRFVDICVAGHGDRLEATKAVGLTWRRMGERVTVDPEAQRSVPVQSLGPLLTQAGSSLGNMDSMIPLIYPMPAGHNLSPLSQFPHPHRAGYPIAPVPDEIVRQGETPRLHVEYWRTHLHARPAELYLGASTSQRQLQFFTFYDQRVFGDEIVREWLGEIKDATLWYLGQPQGSGKGDAKTKSKL